MFSYVTMFIFGIVLLCSWIGWGEIVAIAIKIRMRNLGFLVGLGLSFIIVLGGFLNIFTAISKFSLWAIIILGLIFFLHYLISEHKNVSDLFLKSKSYPRNHRINFLALALLIIMIFFRYSSVVSYERYNIYDDYQGYFVFPEKMMQTGSIGSDPYSERRLVSSIGGQSFLDTFILLLGSERNFALLDAGVAYLAFLLITASYLWKSHLARKYSFLILLIAAFILAPIANITSFYVAMSLFLLAIGLFHEEDVNGLRGIAILALTVSALCALKNSFALPCGFLVISFFAKRYNEISLGKIAKEVVMFVGIFIVLILSWLLSSYISSGTMFYPILGKGFHGSVYGDFLLPTDQMNIDNFKWALSDLMKPLSYVAGLLVIIFCTSKQFRSMISKADFFSMIWIIPSFLLLTISTGGYGAYRYSFAFVFPVVIILLLRYIEGVRRVFLRNHMLSRHFFVVCVLIIYLVKSALVNIIIANGDMSESFKFGITGKDIISSQELKMYNDMQMVVPPGRKLLVRLNDNFALDFRRNEIFIADYPGGSSLPPGLPFQKGPEVMAKYFSDHGIRYIAYSYRDEAMFTFEDYKDRLSPNTNAWIRTEAEHAFDFNDNLKLLGYKRERIYDNGNVFVLDLDSRI